MAQQNFKSLVVGVDLSDYSKIVFAEAQKLSSKMKIPMIVVFVFQELTIYGSALLAKKLEIAETFSREIREKYKLSAKQRVEIKFGSPAEEILAVAKKCERPLVLVGHRGHNSIVTFFIGSTAEKLALTSPYPVWIHRGKKVLLPKKVLVPCDFSSQSERTLSEISSFQKDFKASLESYHVFQEPFPLMDAQTWSVIYREMKDEDEKRLITFRKKHPSVKVVSSSGNVVDKIQRHSKGFDLIALSPSQQKKQQSGFGRITAKLVRSGDKPILVLP